MKIRNKQILTITFIYLVLMLQIFTDAYFQYPVLLKYREWVLIFQIIVFTIMYIVSIIFKFN